MVKVLNIITDMNIGGAGNVLMNFMRNTNRSEFHHTVMLPEGAQLAPILRALDIDVIEVRGIAEKSFHLGSVRVFKQAFARLNPELVHTHASLSARIATRLWSKKCAIVHTRHCVYPQGRFKTVFPMKQALGLINNRLSDLIIAVSPAAGDNLIETGTSPDKILTVFNGVEPMRELPHDEKGAVKASLGIADDRFICAVIARLVPEKGHEYILGAAEILKDLPITFIIAGSGPILDRLRAIADDRGLDNCVFTGFIEDIATIENIMDLQLNASYGTEATSLSLLEGMSLGIPAVVSDFGGNPYIITDGDNGTVVPQHDPAALASAIRRLFDDPETLARMGGSSLQAFNGRFTAQAMTAGVEQVYRDAVKLRAGSAKSGKKR